MQRNTLRRPLLLPLLIAAVPASATPGQDQDSGTLARLVRPKAAGQEDVQQQGLSLGTFRRELKEVEAMLVVDLDLEGAHSRLRSLVQRLAQQSGAGTSSDQLDAVALTLLSEVMQGEDRGAGGYDATQIYAAMDVPLSLVPESSKGSASSAPSSAAPHDRMKPMVRSAVTKNPNLIHELGAIAGPALADIVVEDLDHYPDLASHDALAHLVNVDPVRGGEVVLQNLTHDGLFWKKRVARALDTMEVFRLGTVGQHGLRGDVPPFTKALEMLMRDPRLRESVQECLVDYARYQALTPAMGELFLEEIFSDNPSARARGRFIIQGSQALSWNRSLVEKALTAQHEAVRSWAADLIAHSKEWNDALAACAGDPSVLVRRSVARMLTSAYPSQRHATSTRLGYNNSSYSYTMAEEEIPAFIAVFEKLALDEDLKVRTSVANSLSCIPCTREWSSEWEPVIHDRLPRRSELITLSPSVEVLLALGRDPQLNVAKSIMGQLGTLPIEVCEALLMANTEQHHQTTGFAQALARLRPKSRPQQTAEVLYEALKWLSGPAASKVRSCMKALTSTPEGGGAFIGVILEEDDPDLGRQFLESLPLMSYGGVSADLLEEALRILDGSRQSRPTLWSILKEIPQDTGLLRVAKKLAVDSTVSPEARVWASVALHKVDTECFIAGIREALAGGWFQSDPVGARGWGHIESELRDFQELWEDKASIEELVVDLIETPGVPVDQAHVFVYRAIMDGSRSVQEAVLRHWFDNEAAEKIVGRAFINASRTPELRDDTLLERAVRSGRDNLARQAVSAINSLRDPALLPLLAECVDRYPGQSTWSRAVEATAGFLSDEAAEILLHAAQVANNEEERQLALTNLGALREYHLAREYWNSNRVTARARDNVIAELMQLLAEDQPAVVRQEAARGLGTYRAKEAIPALIRLIQEGDEALRAAAAQALERINQPAPAVDRSESDGE